MKNSTHITILEHVATRGITQFVNISGKELEAHFKEELDEMRQIAKALTKTK